jgi:hypothetical protein
MIGVDLSLRKGNTLTGMEWEDDVSGWDRWTDTLEVKFSEVFSNGALETEYGPGLVAVPHTTQQMGQETMLPDHAPAQTAQPAQITPTVLCMSSPDSDTDQYFFIGNLLYSV